MITHPFQFNSHQIWTTLDPNYIINTVRDIEIAIDRLHTTLTDNIQLEYWIFGAYSNTANYNHLHPSFIPEDISIRFHLIDPLFKTNPFIIYRDGDPIYPILISRFDNIVSIYEHPTLPYKYWIWAITAPGYDYDGWARLKMTLMDMELRNRLLEFRPTEEDKDFVVRFWSAIYKFIVHQAKPTIIIDLVKYIYDPPYRCNLPELRDMVNELLQTYSYPVIYGSWSYNWMPECYSISYKLRGYRHLLHTGKTTAKKIATSIKLLLDDLESIEENNNNQTVI